MSSSTESIHAVLKTISEHNIRYVDLRFTDTHGKEQHITLPAHALTEDTFLEGKAFDGSSIAGWKEIHESDMILLPDPSTAVQDPFFEAPTLNLRCNVVDPKSQSGYLRDPRTIAQRAEAYLKETGIADVAYFGPEPEFFVFDDVRWEMNMHSCGYHIDSEEGAWNSQQEYEQGNMGHRPRVKGGYFPVPPVDASQDLRSHMCDVMTQMGLTIEVHHHEVATANQNEIGVIFNTLTHKADEVQIYKYVVHNVAHQFGKTATFMPKPLMRDNGSGMHCHQSLAKGGKNLFSGNEYAGLSQTALYYIGGIIRHAKALNALTNASTNSYKRLVPGYEAPVLLAYSACNRSASIRIPHASAKAKRIEVRFPDSTANPYLAFSAMLMSGLDGIQRKIHPGDAIDHNLYDLPPKALKRIPTVSGSLEEALFALQKDYTFLTQGNVFTEDTLDAYISLKEQQVDLLRTTVHPIEFDLYYSV